MIELATGLLFDMEIIFLGELARFEEILSVIPPCETAGPRTPRSLLPAHYHLG